MRPTLLFALLLGVFMGALDNAILAPAIAAISADFGITPDRLTLAFSIYAVIYAVAVPILGRLADLWGYKTIFGLSMALFAGGSALSALSGSLEALVGARVVQALGAGGLFPVAQAVVGAVLPERERGRVLGQILGVYALGNVIGPNLGGFIVEHFSWHWVFWINVPIGALGVLLLARETLPRPAIRERIDWIGGGLVALTFSSLVLGIQGLDRIDEVGFASAGIGGRFALALVGGALLYLWERRHPEPILDLDLALSPRFLPIWFVSTLVGYALLGGLVFAPLYAQVAFLFDAFRAGAILNALAVALVFSSAAGGALIHRAGARRLVIVGMGLTALGLGAMTYLGGALAGLLLGLFLVGLGIGLVQPPISHLALALAPSGKKGQIAGLVSLTRSLGVAAGITLSGVLLARRTRELAALAPGGFSTPMDMRGSLADAPAFVQAMLKHTLAPGILDGWRLAFLAALAGLVAAFWIRRD